MHGKDFVLNLAGRGSVLSGAVNARATLTTGRMDLPLAVTGTWREAVVDRDEDALRPSLDTPDKSTAEDATRPSP
jgi:hypothetical protein